MDLFVGWRPMEDRIGPLGCIIEKCLWGDSRARHTFLLVSTEDHPLTMIEIDVGSREKHIHKSMTLNIVEMDDLPPRLYQLEHIGTTSTTTRELIITSAENYVRDHPNYHVLLNNCRTFVEYLIDQMPEFRDSVARKDGSVLEYYHSKAKHEHPGALFKSKQLVRDIRDAHRRAKEYKYASQLVLNVQSPRAPETNRF